MIVFKFSIYTGETTPVERHKLVEENWKLIFFIFNMILNNLLIYSQSSFIGTTIANFFKGIVQADFMHLTMFFKILTIDMHRVPTKFFPNGFLK